MILENEIEFLEKLAPLFLLHGAKSLTMDDIAKEFSISKKTLYQHYSNKEDLLQLVLNSVLDKVVDSMTLAEKNEENAIAKMMWRDEEFEKFTQTNKNLFIRQLIKYYPQIYHDHIINLQEKMTVVFCNNIELGRKQGLYKLDFDEKLYTKFILQLFLSFDSSPLFEDESNDKKCLCTETIVFYLKAIVTEEGRKILEKMSFREEFEIDNQNIKEN